MSIKIASEIKRIDEQEFYEIDYQVTALARIATWKAH
jgi:hypothetical protein